MGLLTPFPSCLVGSIMPLHERDHSLVRHSEPGRSWIRELMTTIDPFYPSVPGDPFLMFRSCSWAKLLSPGDQMTCWRRALCLSALVTLAFC